MAWDDDMTGLAEAVDDAFGVSITLRRLVPGSMNTSTMVRAKTLTDTVVDAVRSRSRTDGGRGGARVEQVRYLIRASLLSVRPDGGDHILDGSKTYIVTACELSVDEKMYEVDAERGLTAP